VIVPDSGEYVCGGRSHRARTRIASTLIEVERTNPSQQLAVSRREGSMVVYALSTPDVADLVAAGHRDGLVAELRSRGRQ